MPRTKAGERPKRAPKPVTEVHPLQQLIDQFSNPLARMGQGTPSLLEGTQYSTVRLSNQYQLLTSLYREHWIVRNIVDVPADDMMKHWVEIQTQEAPDQIDRFKKVIRKTQTRAKLLETIKWARLFGGAIAVMAIKGHEDIWAEPLDLDDVELNSYQGLLVFDRWSGVYPGTQICGDISRPLEFGLPEHYQIQRESGQPILVHASRCLRFTGPTVPRWELQAQMYWGISEIEVMFEELKKRDNTSWAIANILFRANIMVIKDDAIAQMVSGIGLTGAAAKQAYAAYEKLNMMMNNQGLVALTTKGGMESHQYSFAGMSEIEVNAMMNIAGACRMPMSRVFGRTASGLGQANEGDEGIYNDRIQQEQEGDVSPQLDKLFPVVAISTWGQVPVDFDHKWLPVQMPTNEERAELAKSKTDGIMVAFNGGVIGLKTTMKELQQISEETGMFSNITDEAVAAADDTPAAQKQAEMGGDLSSLMGGGDDEDGSSGNAFSDAPKKPGGEKEKGILQKMLAALTGKGKTSKANGSVPQPSPGGRDAMPVDLIEARDSHDHNTPPQMEEITFAGLPITIEWKG